MSEESANWCRFAQLMINKGSEVLRIFLQLDILTSIFAKYSDCWRESTTLTMSYTKRLWLHLHKKHKNSTESGEVLLNDLLKSWRTPYAESTIMSEIHTLKRWKSDVKKQQHYYVSDSVKNTLESWLSQIQQEIQCLIPMRTIINKLEDTFYKDLYSAQRALLLKLDANDKFLDRRRHELLSQHPKGRVPELVEEFRKDLNMMKMECYSALRAFKTVCNEHIISGLKETPKGFNVQKFKHCINDMDITTPVNEFCDIWYKHLENVFDKCAEGNDETYFSSLNAISSFTDMKIRVFFRDLSNKLERLKPKRLPEKACRALKNISGVKDLDTIDLTLLIFAFKETYSLKYQPHDQEDVPDWDKSTFADILRLSSHRNNIVGHIAKAALSTASFERLWQEVKMLLCNIASRCGDSIKSTVACEIDDMKTKSLEPHRILELRKEYITWCETYTQVECPGYVQFEEMMSLIERGKKNLLQEFSCSECMKLFSTDWELAQHRKIHEVRTCLECMETFTTEAELETHRTSHRVRTCPECMETFTTEAELETHRTSHRGLECIVCGEILLTESEIGLHVGRHKDEAIAAAKDKIRCSWLGPVFGVIETVIGAENAGANK